MRSSHAAAAVNVVFDEPNLIAAVGLVPVVALAGRGGLPGLVDETVKITGAAHSGGANAGATVMSVLAGMVAGADSITDTDRLRHAGMPLAFDGIRAPSTVGTLLRSFSFGHVRQVPSVGRPVLAGLAAQAPLVPEVDTRAVVDVDSPHRQVYGYATQGGEVGWLQGQKTLHPLLATLSTPTAAPVVAGVRLRRGKAADVRGGSSFVAEALATARRAGATGMIVLRGEAQFSTAEVVAAARRAGACVRPTTGSTPSVDAALAALPAAAWTPVPSPDARVDPDTGQLVSAAEVAETGDVAFASKPARLGAPGRLVVRRVKRLNPPPGQDGLCDVWRYHAVFVTSPFVMRQAESDHRGHAVIAQLIADAQGSALAPALRVVRRHRRLGHPVGDRAQPDPGRRGACRTMARHGRHRHGPHPPGQRPHPAGPQRPPADRAPARALALAAGVRQAARRPRPPAAIAHRNPDPPPAPGPTADTTSGKAGQTGGQPASWAHNHPAMIHKNHPR